MTEVALVTLITIGMKLYSPNMHKAKATKSRAGKESNDLSVQRLNVKNIKVGQGEKLILRNCFSPPSPILL